MSQEIGIGDYDAGKSKATGKTDTGCEIKKKWIVVDVGSLSLSSRPYLFQGIQRWVYKSLKLFGSGI